MFVFPKTDVIRFAATLITAVAAALAVSFLSGQEAVKSCLAAATISGLAVCISLIPKIYAAAYRPALLAFSGLAAGVLRLLLMLVGTIIMISFVKVNILWFVVWIGAFYPIILIRDITFAIHAANRREIMGADSF
jgi:hypothetical protein